MYGFIPAFPVFAVILFTTSTGQLINMAGLVSVSVSPNDATCGRTSTDHYCRVDIADDAGCVDETCRTECQDKGPTYRDLLREVSGFNYDGSVTNTTKYFDGDDVTVAVFNRAGRLAFLRGTVNITTLEEFTLTFRVRPERMETESSVIDIHGSGYLQRLLNVRIGLDLGVTVVSGLTSVTCQAWKIPRHAWTHVDVQFRQNRLKVYLNGSDESETSAVLNLLRAADMSHVNLKIGQTFAGDLTETHIVEEKPPIDTYFCDGLETKPFKTHDCYCNEVLTSTDLPPSEAHFCVDKIDGWYRQSPSGYTQCRAKRQVNRHSCNGIIYSPDYRSPIGLTLVQCQFCAASCRCELNCTGGNANERCDALTFACRDGEQKVHPKYCDEYYFCVKGTYVHRQCVYPDRWSVEHRRCDRYHSVSCGTRIPKNHPCDRETTSLSASPPPCDLDHHPASCLGKNNGLYYKLFDAYGSNCGIYGCINETLITLSGTGKGLVNIDFDDDYRSTFSLCVSTYDGSKAASGINPASGVCDVGASCLKDIDQYVFDSPYMWCTVGDVSTSRYDCRDYWRCKDGLWMWHRCPEGLVWSDQEKQCVSYSGQCGNRWLPETQDAKERQFIGQLADIRLYDVVLSQRQIQELVGLNCTTWGRDAHPVKNLVDSDSSTFWLSRPRLESVDLLFDLRGMYKLEEVSMTFFGPVPIVVSIFKKATLDDSWQLWRVFRDDCRDVSKCTELGDIKLDSDRLTFNLLDVSLGPLQRRATSLKLRLSGHRMNEGTTRVRSISYFGLYGVAIRRRESSRCGSRDYLEQESSRLCMPCDCDVRGVIDSNIDCNEVGGQCSCKRYVTGRRCDRCLPGYSHIQETDTDGCSEHVPETTAAFMQKMTPAAPTRHADTTTTGTTMTAVTATTTTTNTMTTSFKSRDNHQEGLATSWRLYMIPVFILVVIITV